MKICSSIGYYCYTQAIDDVAHAEDLLTERVNLWVTIRGYSIAATWMVEYKEKRLRNQQACANRLVECHKNNIYFWNVIKIVCLP